MQCGVTTDLPLLYQTSSRSPHHPMPEPKIKIGLTRGLVDGGEIFAQFSLSSTAHYQHLYTYISAICSREKVLAIYWFNRHDREFVLIHDNDSMDQCLIQSGLHEILYVIAEGCGKLQGYNSKHKPEPIQLKTSSPSSGPSPDTANLDRSSDEEQSTQRDHGIPLRKMKKSQSLEWSYDTEHPPSVQEVSSRDESAFDMTARGERPTYYPYLEHYQPSYPSRPKPHRTPTRSKRPEPKHKYPTHSDESGSMSDSDEGQQQKEAQKFLEEQPAKPPKKAKRRANRAALEQKRQEIEMESFKDFASTVTADYLAEMFSKASNGRRLIWVSLWLASFVYAWYNIALSIGVFVSKPTATKLNFYEAPPEGVTFPTVTICNFNKFNKSYFESSGDDKARSQLKQFLIETTPIWGHGEELDAGAWEKTYSEVKKFEIKDLLKAATHTLEDTVEFCKFSGGPCKSDVNTSTESDAVKGETPDPTAAFRKVFTEHGLCYSFNYNGSLKMSRTGALYGLSLRLHVAQDDYFETQDVAGFKVLLHNYYEPPMIEEFGFALRPGSESYVRIRLQKYKDTPRPLGYCDPYLEQQFPGGYTISQCVMQNRAKNMLRKCSCIAFYMDRVGILPSNLPYKPKICNLYQERTCVEPLLDALALGKLVIDGEKVPDPDCPSPCVYTTYTYTISQSEYPSSSVKDKIIKAVNEQKGIVPSEEGSDSGDSEPWTIERIRDNYLKVHIYFEELSTLEMERHPSYLISNLIGDVGGQLGLLLGMNICSLVQFSDYIVRFSFFNGIMRLLRYYKEKKKQEFVNID